MPELPVGSKVGYRDHITNGFNVGIVSTRDARLYEICTEHGTHLSRNCIDLKQTDAPFKLKPVSNFVNSKHAPTTVPSNANVKLLGKRVNVRKCNSTNSIGLTLKSLIHWHPCPHPIILIMFPMHSSLMHPLMLSSLLGTYNIMQMVGLGISYLRVMGIHQLRVMGIHQPGTVVTLPTMIPPSGRVTKIPGILTPMPVNLLMTLMVNGNRRVTMLHHIKIKIPHIAACTNLISSSPGPQANQIYWQNPLACI